MEFTECAQSASLRIGTYIMSSKKAASSSHPIRKAENILFAARQSKVFFKDGIPSPERYERSYPRTVLVFRQANAIGAGGDIRELPDSVKGNTRFWGSVASWCFGLADSQQRPAILWQQWKAKEKGTGLVKDITDILQPFGLMNFDKVAGGAVSTKRRMKDVARTEGGAIKQQLELYKPNVIVACGLGDIFDLLKDILDEASGAPKCLGERRFHAFKLAGQTTYLIEACHPSHRKARYPVFEEVLKTFRHVTRQLPNR